jgi:methylmalonyl-CoA mutase N-terminal domain/subunit
VTAIETGVVQRMIEDSAYRTAQRVESGESVVVGVNSFVDGVEADPPVMSIDPALEREQTARLAAHRAGRDGPAVESALERLRADAADTATNVVWPMKEALRVGATLGEVSGELSKVFGHHRPQT